MKLGKNLGLLGAFETIGGWEKIPILRNSQVNRAVGRLNSSMRRLCEAEDDLDLVDLPLVEGKCTLSRGWQNQNQARLDKFMIPYDWFDL